MKNHLISWIYPSCATILHARKFQWFNNDRKFIFGSPIWGFSAADVIVDPIVAYNKYSKKGPFHLWKKITVKIVVGQCFVWANSCVDTISRTIRAQPKKKGSEKKKKTLENDYIVNPRVGLHRSVFASQEVGKQQQHVEREL